MSVSPATDSLSVGATQQFAVSITYKDGTQSPSPSGVTWSSSNNAIATINSQGVASALAAGSSTITASYQGLSAEATLAVTAATKTLSSISLSPSSASLQAGVTQQFTATGHYSDSSTADLTKTVVWSSSNTSVMTINTTGLATAVSAGSATIAASYQGVTANATVSISTAAKALSAIALAPATATLQAGATQQFKATATYSDKSTGDLTNSVTWVSSNPAVATISATGLATAASAGSATITASQNGINATASITVNAPAQTLAITPTPVTLAAGATKQLTATESLGNGTTQDVTSTATWSSSNTAVATVNASGLVTSVAAGSTKITAQLNGLTASDQVTVSVPSSSAVGITTWHVDNNRSGLNANETTLTASNVSADHFGKLFSYQVDGYVYGSPLIASNVTVNGATHNVLYVATENDSVYAFDADSFSGGTPLWQISLLKSGEAPITSGPIKPVEGVTSTPVIDPSTNTLYVVSAQKASSAPANFRLHALDLATGAEKFGGPVTLQASMPGSGTTSVNGTISLTTSCLQRAALLLANNTVYIGFGSCPKGWLLAYDAQSLAQVGAFNSSPNLDGEGTYASAGGIWMGGGGPVADGSGNIYVVTGNGPWDGSTAYSDSILKFNPKLQLLDYFTPDVYAYLNCADSDLASGGLLLIPGTSQALTGGKQGKLFLVNTSNLGHEQANDAGATQTLWFEQDLSAPYSSTCTDASGDHTTMSNSYEIFGTAAYFNGSVYLGITPTAASTPAGVRQFTYNGQLTPGAYTAPSVQQNTRGTSPFISSNGSHDGILWMIDTGQPIQNSGGNTPSHAILRAYDAAQFPKEIYDTSMNASDVAGYGIKFSSPVVANGKAYISTGHDLPSATNPKGEIDVYGLK